ncbi:MAG: hypothetical protein IJR19_01060, partial [Lachnospiraceae bacterium]|nr:hypothetical protein [Lachnospiraceae bacterium]
MTVFEKLKKLRAEKHFSDKDVAEILGMRQDAYLRIEHGIGKISSFLKNRLALLYDRDPEYFTDDPEPESEIPTKPEPEPVSEAEPETETKPDPEPGIGDKSEPAAVVEAEETVIHDNTAVNIEIQYAGKTVLYSDILDRVKELTGWKEDIRIYIKPEDDRVYYVAG